MIPALELVPGSSKLLREPCEAFDFAAPPYDPIELAEALVAFMYEKRGLGLSANQVGIPYRVFCMRGDPENFVCYNPKVVFTGGEDIVLEEGCLSFPDLFVKVKRPRECRLRFNTPNGQVMTKKFTDLTARVVLHEIDHLDGILFFERASRIHRERAFRQAERTRRIRESRV